MLVDGDNAQPDLIGKVLAETARYGTVTARRVYGDWTTPNMGGWKATLQTYSIQPIQQFRYTTGKNATDSALIIDAMDLLHAGFVNGFCIVSSDSDYTRLAMRIREQGLFVMGIGQNKTPKAFTAACEVFVFTENLSPPTPKKSPAPKKSTLKPEPPAWVEHINSAIETAAGDDGWASLAAVGNYLQKLDSAFDSRTYGFKQLSQLIKSRPEAFEVKGSAASMKAKVKP